MPFLHWSIIIVIPALLLSLYAQYKVKSTFNKYSKVQGRRGMTGAEVAAAILRDSNIQLVQSTEGTSGQVCAIEAVGGHLTDHYDPRSRTLRLSEGVYHGTDVAALGVAAHEVGHAIQHANAYAPLVLRSAMYPMTSIGTTLAFPLFFIGLFITPQLVWLGIALYTLAVAFTVVTLPVEFNASSRALKALSGGGYLTEEELQGSKKVLSAAALTYVAAATMAILQLVQMFIIARD